MGDVLKRAHIGLGARGAAADQQNGHAGEPCIRHRRNGVGDAWPRRYHRDTELPRELTVSMSHMHGRPFVANVYNADTVASNVVPNWLNVTTLQTKNSIDSPCLEKSRNPCRTTVFAGSEVL